MATFGSTFLATLEPSANALEWLSMISVTRFLPDFWLDNEVNSGCQASSRVAYVVQNVNIAVKTLWGKDQRTRLCLLCWVCSKTSFEANIGWEVNFEKTTNSLTDLRLFKPVSRIKLASSRCLISCGCSLFPFWRSPWNVESGYRQSFSSSKSSDGISSPSHQILLQR